MQKSCSVVNRITQKRVQNNTHKTTQCSRIIKLTKSDKTMTVAMQQHAAASTNPVIKKDSKTTKMGAEWTPTPDTQAVGQGTAHTLSVSPAEMV